MGTALEGLKARLTDVQSLRSAGGLVSWEQQTYMPEGGATTRAGHLAILARLEHEMFTAEETGRLLDTAERELDGASYDDADVSLVRVTKHDYAIRTKVPAALVAEISAETALATQIWAKARAQSDFNAFAPSLEKMVDLTRQLADYLGYASHPYDALLDQYEPGTTTADVVEMFAGLRRDLLPIANAIAERKDSVSDAPIHRNFDVAKQKTFTEQAAAWFGFDFKRGRQDQSPHPFCQSLSPDDVRITTRFIPNFLSSSVFGTMHETGHALYEQGAGLGGLHPILASGTSLGVHESQSRMWENIVGRSRGYWSHFYPQLQALFPESLSDVDMETFYRAINKSEPSHIRVEADEVTYNLHIMLRFEMETDLVSGKLSVKDAPDAWEERSQGYLGLTPPDHKRGILQDVHWSIALIGYFPTYSIGNLLSAQFYETALKQHPSIPDEIAQGRFDTLLGWLRENIHQHGRRYFPQELVQRVTGEKINSRAYIAYLRAKFGEIYGF